VPVACADLDVGNGNLRGALPEGSVSDHARRLLVRRCNGYDPRR
jgi:hypothetical protein